MNKAFKKFLDNRPDKGGWVRYKANGQKVVCYHDETQWCQECIVDPPLQKAKLQDGSIGEGYIITSL